MIRPIRGMRDIYGIELEKYDYIIEQAKKIGKKYGYKGLKTPTLEYTEIFQRSIGDETDVVSKEMYTFKDKAEESVTLRPEGTAGVIRAILSENLIQALPLRVMYYGEMFRYERPQKGRYRQFHQIGFENIGEKNPYVDVMTMLLANEFLQTIGIFDFKFLLNTLGDEETRSDYTRAIVKYFSRYEKNLSEDSQIRLKKNPLRILDSKNKEDLEICSMAPRIIDYITKDAGQYFECICNLIEKSGINYEINYSLVRGLDYYTHTAFEIKSTGGSFKDAIGGGGRYDNLIKLFGGPEVSGIGFAFGLERLMLLLDNAQFETPARKIGIVPVSDNELSSAFDVCLQLNSLDIPIELIPCGTISKKMKVANRLNCSIAIIIGESEVYNNVVTVKFMNETNEELKNKVVKRSELTSFLKYKA